MSYKKITSGDTLKLRVTGARLRDIFARDNVNPIESGAQEYTIRAVIEALGIDGIFYEVRPSPFIPPESEGVARL